MKQLHLLLLLGALFSLLILNQVFLDSNLYSQISWLDIPMHFFGGLLVGLIGIYFLSSRLNTRQKIPAFFILIVSLFTALVVGLIWEMVEINSETILNLKLAEVMTNEDTRSDLLFDVIGASVGAVICIIFKKGNGQKSSPLFPRIKQRK